MNRAYKLGCWAVLAAGCSFNQTPPPDPPPDVPTEAVFHGEAVSAQNAPAPISGGTLLVSKKAPLVFASNPDANVVDVIDLDKRVVAWRAELGDDTQPGRLAEDANGLVHVVLRRAGAIATLDPKARTITKQDVCPAPRGITANAGALYVTCAGGELVTIADTGTTAKTMDRDLRDVVVRADGSMYVTRFRSAEVLDIDASGNLVGRVTPDNALDRLTDANGAIVSARFQPDAAWRSAPAKDGSLYVLHQYATTRSIAIHRTDEQKQQSSAPYGGGGPTDPCGNSKLVVPALTRIAPGEAPRTMRLTFDAPGFDMAISPVSGRVAVAGANQVTSFVPDFPYPDETNTPSCNFGNNPQASVPTDGQPIAVAFTAQDQLIIQTRDPAVLIIGDGRGTGYVTNEIPLSETAHDTGFKVFHTPTQAGIACVSCHPEGGDDGHVWTFAELGARRTQSLRGGIMATAPFHWGGDMHDVSQLAHDVFTNRMGGGSLTEPQIGVLASWLDRQPAVAMATPNPGAIQHGQALFASSGCTKCHAGAHLTNNENADVGTGGSFQVPSLVNVSSRAPFMHDGCAPTLMDRFTNPKCGGDHHGDTSALAPSDLADLVSYLETL